VNETPFDLREYVSVAVAFDDRAYDLSAYAADLAAKLGKKLCLIHAVEPWLAQGAVQPFGLPAGVWENVPAVQAAALASANKQMQELKSKLEKKGPVTSVRTEVVEGMAVDAIIKLAANLGTCLLVVGGAYEDVKFFPAGLATGPALANAASMPVMIVDPKTNQKPAPHERLRILLADDLEAESDTAVSLAASLADAYRGAWVYHLHVNALNAENLAFGLQSAASAARTVISQGEIDSVAAAVEKTKIASLERRFSPYREYVEASDGKYTADVVAGSTKSQLRWVSDEFEPDVLVFGRHKTMHHKPFSLGRMPYRAMLRLRRPIVIVPHE